MCDIDTTKQWVTSRWKEGQYDLSKTRAKILSLPKCKHSYFEPSWFMCSHMILIHLQGMLHYLQLLGASSTGQFLSQAQSSLELDFTTLSESLTVQLSLVESWNLDPTHHQPVWQAHSIQGPLSDLVHYPPECCKVVPHIPQTQNAPIGGNLSPQSGLVETKSKKQLCKLSRIHI